MTCRSGVVSVAIVVRTARTTASVLTPEPISLRARTQRSGRVLYTCVRPWRAWAGRAWAGDLDPADPRISPLYDDLSALPPMLIFQGDADILGPDTIEFARKAARAGVDVRLRVEPGGLPRLRPVRPLHSRGRGRHGPQRSLRDGHSQEPLRPRVSRTFHGLVGGRDEAVEETRGRCGEAQFR